MLVQKDSASFVRACDKSFRLSPDMFKMRIEFLGSRPIVTRRVVGSRGFVYTVSIQNDGISCFNATCDCPAGNSEMCCYHVAAVYDDMKRQERIGGLYPMRILSHAFQVENVFQF